MQLGSAIKKRHSVRNFLSKKPDWRDIVEAIDSTKYAPTAGNLFNLKFIMIDDKKKIDSISENCQQDFISQAKYVVVVCSDISPLRIHYGEDAEKYSHQQTGAAIQNFLLSLQEFGLSTTWIGYFNEKKIKKDLKIPEEISIESIFPIGYEKESQNNERKRKPELENFIRFNDYENKELFKKPNRLSA